MWMPLEINHRPRHTQNTPPHGNCNTAYGIYIILHYFCAMWQHTIYVSIFRNLPYITVLMLKLTLWWINYTSMMIGLVPSIFFFFCVCALCGNHMNARTQSLTVEHLLTTMISVIHVTCKWFNVMDYCMYMLIVVVYVNNQCHIPQHLKPKPICSALPLMGLWNTQKLSKKIHAAQHTWTHTLYK